MDRNLKKKFSKLKIDLINSAMITEGKTIIVNRNRFDPVMRSLFCASVFNYYKKQKIVLFTKKKYVFTNKIYKNFGIKDINIISVKDLIFKNIILSILFFFLSLFKYIVYSFFGIDSFIKQFNYKKVYLGMEIHESFLKKNKYYKEGSFFLPIFYFIKIFSGFILINYLEKYLEQNQIKNIIIHKKNYFDIDTILFLISKKKNLNCLIVSNEDIINNHNNSIYKNRYFFSKKELLKKISKKKIEKFLRKKFRGLTDKDANYAHNKKLSFEKEKMTELFGEKRRKVVLFCPHVFSDSCSATGEFLYRDFFDYFYQTIKELQNIKDINWIVKMHPSRKFYHEEKVAKKFTNLINSKNIHVISDKYNILSIIRNVDAVVTAKGTIILEATILGKKVLGYKNNRFQNSNIYLKYKNKFDYYNKLRFKNLDLKVSQKDKDLAKKILYLYSIKAYGTKDNLLQDVRLKNSIQKNNYYKDLLNKLKKGKITILKSDYYREIKKKLLN